MFRFATLVAVLLSLSFAAAQETKPRQPQAEEIDFEKAREIFQRFKRGENVTAEEEAYVRRAQAARSVGKGDARQRPVNPPRATIGVKPLSEMTADDVYKGENGGLYGDGRNSPPEEHRRAAEKELTRIEPLDAEGKPAKEGKIALVSISMSNATQEFSRFKQLADADSAKSDRLTIVDCAQGGQAMAEWVDPEANPWREALRRLERAGVDPRQVQVAWIKLANKGPSGDLAEHGRKLAHDTLAVIQNARTRFPNLRIAYLSSRIYGGYAASNLNPEPYAYESAFAVRWLIQDQMKGNAELNWTVEADRPVKAPLLLWGPYLWADGTTPRAADKLVYTRDDLSGDGTHPSEQGRDKVARVMLDFFKTDPLAKSWFVGR